MNMSFKTTPAPVAKERSRTVYTNNIAFKTTPAPGAKQRSWTVTSGCLVQNGIGSRSQTVPDRLHNKYLVQKRHRLPEPNSPRPLHKGKNNLAQKLKTNGPGPFTSEYLFKQNTGSQSRTVPDRLPNKYLVQKITPAHRAERSRTVYTKAFARDKDKTKDGIKRNKGPGVGPATTE